MASIAPQCHAHIQYIIITSTPQDMTQNVICGGGIRIWAHEYAEDAERSWCESLPGQWEEIYIEYQWRTLFVEAVVEFRRSCWSQSSCADTLRWSTAQFGEWILIIKCLNLVNEDQRWWKGGTREPETIFLLFCFHSASGGNEKRLIMALEFPSEWGHFHIGMEWVHTSIEPHA